MERQLAACRQPGLAAPGERQAHRRRSGTWGNDLREETIEPPALEFSARAATLHEFATVIRSGAVSELDGANNLWSFGAVIAGMESCRNGRTVDVADMIDFA